MASEFRGDKKGFTTLPGAYAGKGMAVLTSGGDSQGN